MEDLMTLSDRFEHESRRRELLTAALAAPQAPLWWLETNPLDFIPEPSPAVPKDFVEAFNSYKNQTSGYSIERTLTEQELERAANLFEAIAKVQARNRSARRVAEHRREIKWRMSYALEIRHALDAVW